MDFSAQFLHIAAFRSDIMMISIAVVLMQLLNTVAFLLVRKLLQLSAAHGHLGFAAFDVPLSILWQRRRRH